MAKDIVSAEVDKVLSAFCEAYCLQKGVDLDEVECVVYEQKNRTIFYFRKKREEIRKYGAEIIQD